MINYNSVKKLVEKNGFVLDNIYKNDDGTRVEDYIKYNNKPSRDSDETIANDWICSLDVDTNESVTMITMVENYFDRTINEWVRHSMYETSLAEAIKKFGWKTK